MDEDLIYLILYSIAFIGCYVYFLLKMKKHTIGVNLLLIYAISSFTTIYFYLNTSQDIGKIYGEALIYLFGAFMVCFYPLLNFDETRIKRISITSRGHKFIVYTSAFLALIMWEGTFEVFRNCLDISASQLASIYDKQETGSNLRLSWIGGKIIMITNAFEFLLPIFVFYLLQYRKKYLLIIIGLSLGILSFILMAYANAQRISIVKTILYLFLVFLVFRPFLDYRIYRVIKYIGVSVGGLLLLIIIVTTLVRYNDKDNVSIDIWTWVSLYTGEGHLRFAEIIWGKLKIWSVGDNCFALIKDILGFPTFTDNWSRREYWEIRQGIPTYIFYTYIGDWVADLGYLLTFVWCFVIQKIQFFLLPSKSKNTITIEKLILLLLIWQFFYLGFTFYIYKPYAVQLNVLFAVFFCIILRLTRFYKSNSYEKK